MAKTRRKSQRCMDYADAGDPGAEGGKRVVLYSDDDAPAKSEIGVLIDRLGFFGIDLGALAAGARLIQFSLRPPACAYLVRFGIQVDVAGQGCSGASSRVLRWKLSAKGVGTTVAVGPEPSLRRGWALAVQHPIAAIAPVGSTSRGGANPRNHLGDARPITRRTAVCLDYSAGSVRVRSRRAGGRPQLPPSKAAAVRPP